MEIGDTITCANRLGAEKHRKDLELAGVHTEVKQNHVLKITEIKEVKAPDRIKTVADMLEEIANEICDHYCKYPYSCKTDDELFQVCDSCPLVNKL